MDNSGTFQCQKLTQNGTNSPLDSSPTNSINLQDNVGLCSLYMSDRWHSGCGADSPHHTSHENTMSNGIQTHTLGIPQYQYNSCLKEYDCHSKVFLHCPAEMHVNC